MNTNEPNYFKEEHYFTPQKENDKFCARCDKYLTDKLHFRSQREKTK